MILVNTTKNKKSIEFIPLLIIFFAGKYIHDMNINDNFEIITERKVYKSDIIPPDELAVCFLKYNI